MRIKIALWLLAIALCLAGTGNAAFAAKEDAELQAAFVRGGDLWVKIGSREKKLAGGPHIYDPKWSFDGAWIAFAKGEARQELWILDMRTGHGSLVSAEGGLNFQWSPNDNKLAYQTGQQLQYVDVSQPNTLLETAEGIGNYSWLPDGKGFFASSQSELLTEGWTPISLYQIPLQQLGDPGKYVTVHVLPKPSDDFFAVGTSPFKWSADGRWIAFLATPTASLSADSNTLCVVSSDGVVFRTLDQMVNHEQWFEWGPRDAQLAYIVGVGREAGSNKRLKVLKVTSGKSGIYTPEGFVDNDFAWQGAEHIVVSREMELKQADGLAERSNPRLLTVELASGKQSVITKPPDAFGDYNPQSLPEKLSWVRSDSKTANVIVSRPNGSKAKNWLTSIDQPDSYYGQMRWDSVLRFLIR
ncbi:translocation protein TolB [Paenibacillus alkaliterrae]|uniref:translocation protein TolB n=1 Tax=Paenibacillus alkaliterrae TaxID=320909 RepID=UPI001F47A157|nr:translocation protein TolB [Paenibacillus alkaliterrae]MCF2938113.1 translocation protein TolB [Paenibacillus alkaliterrae]